MVGHTYPLQLSQRNGKKSSTWQYSIWQCAPTASTSPPFIAVKLSVGVEVMLAVYKPELIGNFVVKLTDQRDAFSVTLAVATVKNKAEKAQEASRRRRPA